MRKTAADLLNELPTDPALIRVFENALDGTASDTASVATLRAQLPSDGLSDFVLLYRLCALRNVLLPAVHVHAPATVHRRRVFLRLGGVACLSEILSSPRIMASTSTLEFKTQVVDVIVTTIYYLLTEVCLSQGDLEHPPR